MSGGGASYDAGNNRASEPILVALGEMACSQFHVITPVGTYPLAWTTWEIGNRSSTTKYTPAWAIVLAVIFSFVFLVGLFFLLIKRSRTEGFLLVSAHGPDFSYVAHIDVASPMEIAEIEAKVEYVRRLVAAQPQ